MAGSQPPWRDWPRRHPVVTGAITLIVLLMSFAIVHEVSRVTGQTTAHQTTNVSAANGNSTACSDYWNMTNAADQYEIVDAAGWWHELQAAVPGITNPALSNAVQAFNQDLSTGDTFDAGTVSSTIGTSCTTLGYSNPDATLGYGQPVGTLVLP